MGSDVEGCVNGRGVVISKLLKALWDSERMLFIYMPSIIALTDRQAVLRTVSFFSKSGIKDFCLTMRLLQHLPSFGRKVPSG